MKYLLIPFFAFSILALQACKKDNQNTTQSQSTAQILKDSIINLQASIRTVSNNLEYQMLNPTNTYKTPDVQSNVQSFGKLRNAQRTVMTTLSSMDPGDTSSLVEMVVCADFEDISCFVSDWDTRKDNSSQVIKFDTTESYNHSTSLYLSSPYTTPGAVDLPGMEIQGYINGIKPSTVYKIRWWGKYRGYTAKDNGPINYVIIIQDGKWLGEGVAGVGKDGSYVDIDWQLNSFQIVTESSSPLQIIFGNNLQDCWIDDIHIVQK
ncbi:MAG TPA: hypothetical protein VN721_00870 [Flavipsychrobacter sp.]|nr:hypothetical protein [Flavipsychrobacter sp.]